MYTDSLITDAEVLKAKKKGAQKNLMLTGKLGIEKPKKGKVCTKNLQYAINKSK